MAETEQRLKALEKRAHAQREQIQALFGDTKALSLTIDALGAAICAANKPLLRTVIKNLRDSEDACRIQNEHDLTIARLRHVREFFEGRLNNASGGGSPSSTNLAPRRGR